MQNRKFEKFINDNFKGLSTSTLFQYLEKYAGFDKSFVDSVIFVNIYNVFSGKAHDKDNDIFHTTKRK